MQSIIPTPVDTDMLAFLDRASQTRGVSREEIVQEAIASYAAEYDELEACLAEGERDIAEGRVVSHEDFIGYLDAMQSRAQEEIERRARPA